ncbi:UbiX family flavin prenyltransferase [Terriglobus sp. ADX1]|uniref:UbiX family flavin prenyltransferase n=1 Tax=Terriglobus sp. ADX1 TaxID=2794063 RepID=UPI002FE51F05
MSPFSQNRDLRRARLTVAMTGASGALFTAHLLRLLNTDDRVEAVHFIASDHALRVVTEELSLTGGRSSLLETLLDSPPSSKFTVFRNDDIAAPVASGSHPSDGMIVLPCSMGTLASIANGMAARLVDRAADVTLKEQRPLILCVRETPFNRIHLRNMMLAAEAGAVIYPVIPAMYFRPTSLDDVARQYCCRVLGHIGLAQPSAYRWKED